MTQYIRFRLLLALLLLVTASVPSKAQGGVDILLSKARSLEARGRIDLAIQNWKKVLLVNPNQTEALAGMARSAKENGQANDERSYLDRLRKVDPRNPQIAAIEKMHVLTADERGRLDEAGRLAMQHKPDEAMKIYRQVFGDQQPPLGKWAQPYYETEAESTGGKQIAVSQLRKLCDQYPKQEIYRLWLASLLTYDPKTRMEGLRLFDSIKDPATVEQARSPWRQALIWEKEDLDALPQIEAYLQHYPDPELQSAQETLRAQQQKNITNNDRVLGFKALQNKDLDAAAARFNEVLRNSPNDVNAITGLGYVRLNQKRFSDALSLFDHARTLAPQKQDARDGYDTARFWLAVERGDAAQRENQPDTAIGAYQEALSIRPIDTGALLGIANALVRERKFGEAEAKFQQVLNQSPNNADAVAGLGFVRLNEKKFDDAQKLFAKARQLDPARKDVQQGYQNAKFWGFTSEAAEQLNRGQAKAAVAAYQQALALNPNDKDALLGFANASDRVGDYSEAAKTYYRLAASFPNDESNWLLLIHTQMEGKAPQDAIATSKRIPPAVKAQMESRSDYLSEMALLSYQASQPDQGDALLQRALQVARTSDSTDALGFRLQIAGALMDQGRNGKAIEIYKQATMLHPDSANAWEGLVGAYTRIGAFNQAASAVRTMPDRSYSVAEKDSGFLKSVAVLYATRGQCEEAEDFLHRSLALDKSQGRPPAESTQLQLADILMRERNYGNARDLYSAIVTNDANSANAWRGYLVALHQQHADRALVAQIPHIPAAVRAQLESDPTFLILEASAYVISNQPQGAVPLLQAARARYTSQHRNPPVELDVQLAWTMLAVSPDEPGLSELFVSEKSRTDLTNKQRDAFQELYSTWSVRRAEIAFESKPQTAFSILTDAAQQYPGDRNIHAALAALYLKRHDRQKALDVFQSWGMIGAEAGDFRVAAGTALSTHKFDLAEQYMHRGLARFPNDPGLLHMTARQDIARGDYDAGERELHSALLAIHEEDLPNLPRTLPAPKADPGSATSVEDHGNDQPAQPCNPETTSNASSNGRIRPISLVFAVARGQLAGDGQNPAGGQQTANQSPAASQDQAQKQEQEQQMQDEEDAVENRNSPLIYTGGVGTGRIGDPGFDQLIIGDTLLGGAVAGNNKVRFGVEGHGVYAYSGTPDGSSTLMFGTLPVGATFGEQSKIGYAGTAQLSTNSFGLEVGTSPQGFAVHNIIGGVSFRPNHSWFTLQGVRDSVKDSLLSYAGSRDPGTGVRWGGVVANTGTLKFDSAPSSNVRYKVIGEYASVSYSFIQGLNVPDNWSAMANGGLYWQIIQGLTVGGNVTGMHYDKNLNYFSFGQGGYFSPQQYYLASIPISWYSRHPRFEYQLKISGGVQYLQQDASPFYPVLPFGAAVTPGTYAGSTTTSPNYDADIRMGYRVAPHVYLDVFATANNARNYYTQSAGFSLKFMVDKIPTSTDIQVNSLPDWTGKQPYSIH
ncbi:MAG TPA: cellulose synthase subunit BcsC-related outer membrane protein [Terracidiphilus sp.]|nr:cellulose synthase subunit BcsC-related outer membrane protein [Terracidiphilus sp.]